MPRGRIFIIASDYVPNTKFTKASSAGMTQTGTYQNYWSSAPTALDPGYKTDILKLFSIGNTYALTSYTNSYCVSKLLTTSYWDDFKDSTYAEYAIGGPTLEMWCESWNNAVNSHSTFKKIYARGTNSTGYYVSSDTTSNQYYLYMKGTTSSLTSAELTQLGKEFPMYFPHTSVYSNCYG